MADTLTTHTHRINQHEPSYTILRVDPSHGGGMHRLLGRETGGHGLHGRVSAYVNRAKGKVLLICTNDGG